MIALQAIVTTFFGPTNHRGSRIRAKAAAGTIWKDYDHALGTEQNHAAAAKALAEKLDWGHEWHAGGLPDMSGYCFVQSMQPAFVTYSKREG